jgi:prepilin signal peptidase PulO-like enzyme (type II secretory pathway)
MTSVSRQTFGFSQALIQALIYKRNATSQFIPMSIDLAFTALTATLGLIMGSFLNVVVHRIPLMLETPADHRFDLFLPRSHCPSCLTPIKASHNIPILSYLALGGRCGYCDNKIPLRYPILEMLSGILSGYSGYRFGLGFETISSLIFIWIALPVIVIALEKGRLAGDLIDLLLWTGLLLSAITQESPIQPEAAIIGTASTYGILLCVNQVAARTSKALNFNPDTMKLCAALGAWIDGEDFLVTLFLASLLASLTAFYRLHQGPAGKPSLPFALFLVFGGGLMLFFRKDLHQTVEALGPIINVGP